MGLGACDGEGRKQRETGQLLLGQAGPPQMLQWEAHGEGEFCLASGPGWAGIGPQLASVLTLSGRVEQANLFSSVLLFGALSACILLDSLLMFHPQHNCSLHSAHTFPRFPYSNCSWHSGLKFFHQPSGAVLIYVPALFCFCFVLWVEKDVSS